MFTKDVIWLEYKRKAEVGAIRLRPHPWEFALYIAGWTLSPVASPGT